MTHDSKTLTHADLHHFTGTENWYRHPFMPHILYTDGVKYVAEKADAYWLLDEIAFTQKDNPRVAAEAFQVWKLQIKPDQSARLTCENGTRKKVYAKRIDYTDFPLAEITFYFTANVILLPIEY
jgi:hypothetical protein